LEDAKDEPGANDFYYGEMDARRHDPLTPRGERLLLYAYWLVSGYGLRATRALGFLLAAMVATWLATMAVGLPDSSAHQQITGTVSARDGQVSLNTSVPDPRLDLSWPARFTDVRAESSSLIVVNSVVFRSSGQSLTPIGTWIEMASRISEPVLIGFAAIAARGRIKR
jgi:hypothetical protein